MKVIDGGVTAAKGFEAAGAEAAIKYQNRKDMAMVYSKVPCKAAGTFTTNVVKAAPVLWDRDIVTNSEYAQAVVVNAGIANTASSVSRVYTYMIEASLSAIMSTQNRTYNPAIFHCYYAGSRITAKETLHTFSGIINTSDCKAFDLHPQSMYLFIILNRHQPYHFITPIFLHIKRHFEPIFYLN